MTVTFLVAVTIEDLSSITEVALDIEDDLVSAGYSVESVKPWARPALQQVNPLSVLPSMVEPPTPQI